MRPSELIPCTMFGISLVCTFLALVLLMTLPKLAPVKAYETRELDFCSNPKKCSNAIVKGNALQRVNLCIEPRGRHQFSLRWRLQEAWLSQTQVIALNEHNVHFKFEQESLEWFPQFELPTAPRLVGQPLLADRNVGDSHEASLNSWACVLRVRLSVFTCVLREPQCKPQFCGVLFFFLVLSLLAPFL